MLFEFECFMISPFYIFPWEFYILQILQVNVFCELILFAPKVFNNIDYEIWFKDMENLCLLFLNALPACNNEPLIQNIFALLQ